MTKMSSIQKVTNRGTGAGGKNTNLHGKAFETMTCNQKRLLSQGYERSSFIEPKKASDFYFIKTFEDKTIVFVVQQRLKVYMKMKYDIDMIRNPDEAYIVEYKDGRKVLKILEKKEQHVSGSVEDKLWAFLGFKKEYEYVCKGFEIHYAGTVSEFLKNKFMTTTKFKILMDVILKEESIPIFFGSEKNYFDLLDEWIQR